MSKFTKGEWNVRTRKYMYTGMVKHIVNEGTMSLEEGIANANLIAAAPEMYRFIELMLEEDVLYCGHDTWALEILAKARGELK